MIDVFKIVKLNPFRKINGRGGQQRVKTAVLLAVIIFATAAQTVHHHASLQLLSDSVHSTEISETSYSSARRLENHDECLTCQLQRQYSSVHIFHAPGLVFSLVVKTVHAAVFVSARFYRLTRNSSCGGRAPPLSFLS